MRFLGVLAAFVVAAIIVIPVFNNFLTQREELRQAHATLEATKERIAELEKTRALWKDPDYVRSQARQRLGYVMPGETLYVVTDPNGQSAQKTHDEKVTEVKRERRASTPWYLTLHDSLTIAGTGEANPNDVPLVNQGK